MHWRIIRIFDETIKKKMNDYSLKFKKNKTPFLSENYEIKEYSYIFDQKDFILPDYNIVDSYLKSKDFQKANIK